MFGKGDRTKVATEDSAGEQTPTITSQKAKDKQKFAEGGSAHMVSKQSCRIGNGRADRKERNSGRIETSVRRLGRDRRRGEACKTQPNRLLKERRNGWFNARRRAALWSRAGRLFSARRGAGGRATSATARRAKHAAPTAARAGDKTES